MRPAEKEWYPPIERSTSKICTAYEEVDEYVKSGTGNTNQFTRRGDDQSTQTILRAPFDPIKHFKYWYEESEGLSTPCLCRAKNVHAFERVRQAFGLYVSHFYKERLFEPWYETIKEGNQGDLGHEANLVLSSLKLGVR